MGVWERVVGAAGLWWGVAALCLVGCGGDSGGEALCAPFSACGGDLEGAWQLTSFCADSSQMVDEANAEIDLPKECGDVVRSMSLSLTGTLTYSGGVEASDMTLTVGAGYLYTERCLTALAGTPTTVSPAYCAQLADAMADGAPEGEVSCEASAEGCACSLQQADTFTEVDTFTVSGSTLTYADGSSMDYCVQGDELSALRVDDVLSVLAARRLP